MHSQRTAAALACPACRDQLLTAIAETVCTHAPGRCLGPAHAADATRIARSSLTSSMACLRLAELLSEPADIVDCHVLGDVDELRMLHAGLL